MGNKRKADHVTKSDPPRAKAPVKRQKIDQSTGSASGLLGRLPTELRNRIYKYVIAGSKASNWSVELKPANAKEETVFGLLRVHKMISEEFRAVLAREATYHIAVLSIDRVTTVEMSGKTYNTVQDTPLRNILTRGVSRFEVHLVFQSSTEARDYDWRNSDGWHHWDSTMGRYKHHITLIANVLDSAPSPIKYIGINLWARSHGRAMSHELVNVKYLVRPFTLLRNVEAFALKLQMCKKYSGRTHTNNKCRRAHYKYPCFCTFTNPAGDLLLPYLDWQVALKGGRTPDSEAFSSILSDFARFLPLRDRAKKLGYDDGLRYAYGRGWWSIMSSIWKGTEILDRALFDEGMKEFLALTKFRRDQKYKEVAEFRGSIEVMLQKIDDKDLADLLVEDIVLAFFSTEVGRHGYGSENNFVPNLMFD